MFIRKSYLVHVYKFDFHFHFRIVPTETRRDNARGSFTISSNLKSAFIAVIAHGRGGGGGWKESWQSI